MVVRPPAPGEPQRQIPDPGFVDDDGSVSPRLASAMAAYDADPANYLAALALLQHERVMVPVVALLGEVEYDEAGLAHDKTSDMATVLMTGPDGRQGLLAFTCLDTLARWNRDARPVPVTLKTAALSAVQEEAHALVIDVAGPTLFVIEGADLMCVAEGLTLVKHHDGWAWAQVSGSE